MQRRGMRRLAAGAMAGLIVFTTAFPAWADSSKKITSVTLEFEADIQPDTDYGEETINIECNSEKFSVDGYEIKNDGFGWEEDSVPELEVTLVADEEYRFSAKLTADRIKLKGEGATYKGGAKKDSGRLMVIKVELNSLAKSLRPMENLKLSTDGVVSWSPIANAGSYELRVYRDGKAVGSAFTTTYNSYNCSEKMTKSANYYVKVRPINKLDQTITGQWEETGTIYVDSAMAANFKANPVTNPEGELPYSLWKQAEDGRWWFDNGDGTYPQACRQEINGKWYFFDEEGYMRTGWIDWEGKRYFCNEDGEMLRNCMTIDNYWLGDDGAVISQDPTP